MQESHFNVSFCLKTIYSLNAASGDDAHVHVRV